MIERIPVRKLLRFPLPEIAGLAALVFAAASPALTGHLLSWDDLRHVVQNEHIRTLAGLPYVLTHVMFEAWQPVFVASYAVDYALWGLWPPGYHVVSLLLWAGGLVLLDALLVRLEVGRPWSFLLAALFALHPLHVESAVWITGRKDVLAFLFFMAGALVYLDVERWASKRGLLVLLFFLLALMSKSHAVIFPFFLFGIDLFIRRRGWKASLARTLPMAAFAVGFSILVYALWQENELARPRPATLFSHLMLILETYAFYLRKLVLPFPLSPVYPILRDPRLSAAAAVMAVLFAAGTWLVVKARNRWASMAWFWLVFSLLPVCNIVPVYFFVADRYALWTVLVLVFLVLYLRDLARASPGPARARALAGAVAVASVVFGLLFWSYAWKWRDDFSLWTHAVAASPASYYAHLKRGEVLRDGGDLDGAGREYRAAIALQPGLRFAYFALCWSESMREEAARGEKKGSWQPVLARLMKDWNDPAALEGLRNGALAEGFLTCGGIAEGRAFALRPPGPRALLVAASIWVKAGKPKRALAHLAKVAPATDEEKLSWHLAKAAALAQTGEKAQALAEVSAAEEVNLVIGNTQVAGYLIELRRTLE